MEEVFETVKEQQQMTQPEDPTVSGESKVAVSKATSKNEVLPCASNELSIICFW